MAAERGRAMLVELSVIERPYHAVMEVVSRMPVTEVAGRHAAGQLSGEASQPHNWTHACLS
jgi:hypothetical protein